MSIMMCQETLSLTAPKAAKAYAEVNSKAEWANGWTLADELAAAFLSGVQWANAKRQYISDENEPEEKK